MPVVINYKICDLAPECGGIEACPTKAFFWNKKTQKPDVDNKKCTSCGVCARECPVNAILVARDQEEFEELVERVKNDPRSEKELWRERLGTQPGRMPPSAKVVTPNNFSQEIIAAGGFSVLDVWTAETLDCRYHSVLWDDLGFTGKIAFKKLDGGKYPDLAKRLKVTKFPTLLLLKNGRELWRREEYLYSGDKNLIKGNIKKFLR